MEFDVVTVVSAARGLGALRQVLAQLPSSFSVPIVCLAETTERTVEELRAATRMRVHWVEPGTALQKGTVYVPRPNCSLVFRPDGTLSATPVSIDSTAHNPVDQFLATAARVHGASSACLILAGFQGDGVEGAGALKAAGATVLVLDRATSLYWGLAEPIVRAGAVDRVLTVAEAADALRACFTGRDLLRCAEIQIELGGLLETALAICGTRMGHIARCVHGASQLKILVHRGLGVRFLERFDRIPISPDFPSARAVLERDRIVVTDLMAHPEYSALQQDALWLGVRAVHATPIPRSSPVHGVLTALFVQPHEVTRHEARDIDGLANVAGPLVAALD